MTYPNILVFVDFPTTDVNAARAYYAEVFNWEVEDRIKDTFARIVPGQNFLKTTARRARSAICTWVSRTRRTRVPTPIPTRRSPPT